MTDTDDGGGGTGDKIDAFLRGRSSKKRCIAVISKEKVATSASRGPLVEPNGSADHRKKNTVRQRRDNFTQAQENIAAQAPPPAPSHPKEKKRVIRLRGLRGVRTRTELAGLLGVPARALAVATVTTALCNGPGCGLPALHANHGRCLLCSQKWFPRRAGETGKNSKTRRHRGYGLFGRQFLRYNASTCCCENPLCLKIGYSSEGMFRLPTRLEEARTAVRLLGIGSVERRETLARSPRATALAYWHYHPRHRERGKTGKWVLRKMATYEDDHGKHLFPPPSADLQQFIDNETGAEEKRSHVRDDLLPFWVRGLAKIQQQIDGYEKRSAGEESNNSEIKEMKSTASSESLETPNERESTPGKTPEESGRDATLRTAATEEDSEGDERNVAAIGAFICCRPLVHFATRSSESRQAEKVHTLAEMVDQVNAMVKIADKASHENDLSLTPAAKGDGNGITCAVDKEKLLMHSVARTCLAKIRKRADITPQRPPLVVQQLQSPPTWGEKLFHLLAFRSSNDGSWEVPEKTYAVPDGGGTRFDLCKFVLDLRRDKKILEDSRFYSNGDSIPEEVARASSFLPPARIEVLNSVGFTWVDPSYKPSWDERYATLVRHHSEHGDCEPRQDKILMAWCSQQKFGVLRKTSHTDPANQGAIDRRKERLGSKNVWAERKAKLDKLGFDWRMKTVSWEDHFEKLRRYQAEHGNCNVKINFEDKVFASWVHQNRKNYFHHTQGKKSPMNEEKISLLESIGFQWSLRKRRQAALDQSGSEDEAQTEEE